MSEQESERAMADDGLTVRTRAGWVRGSREEELRPDTPLTSPVRSWRGIPYGADTSGPNRFLEPRPAPAWEGVRDCWEFGPVAPQPVYSWTDRIEGAEDCLTLDVVRPDTDAAGEGDQLPVVVYLHGGSFILGSSHMLMLRGYEFAARMDVVYVSINFRLGALGYLDVRSLGGEACANPAVADQVLALEWVRDNIAAFGGDPDNVTLMGESAGGAAVLTLMAVPRAEGLFHRAIAQSPPIGMIHSRTQSMFWARELVNKMALPRDTSADDLRAENFADLVRSGQSMMWRAGELMYLNSCYAPTVDGDLIPQHPVEAFEDGAQHPVPLLVGTNSGEASFGKFLYQRQRSRERAALRLLASFDPDSAPDVVAAYGGAVSRQGFGDLLTDALFWAPTVRVASEHSRRHPTWMYRFDFTPGALRWLGLGAMHSMELSNIFGDPGASRVSFLTTMGSSAAMEEVTQSMQAQWASFIRTGAALEEWPRYRAPERSTMVFDVEPQVVNAPMEKRRQAWQDYDMLEWGTGRPEILQRLGFASDGPAR